MTMAIAAVTVATSVGTAAYGASQMRKAKRANNAMLLKSKKAGAFNPLAIPEPQELHIPSAESVLGAWRGDVNTNFSAYDLIAGKLNSSEQAAARQANLAANPKYYQAIDQITSNALQSSKGVIPKDVKQNLLRQANEDAYLRGFSYGKDDGRSGSYAGGNDAAANLALRNLGLSSLDMMKYGDALSGQVLEQSRASRGKVLSAKDTVPTPEIFSNQMNASAIAHYNYKTDKASYKAAKKNAPIQSAYNKLALQMGIAQQNNALGAQVSTNNAQLAMSALQALGGLYGGGTVGGAQRQAGGGAGYADVAAPATTMPSSFSRPSTQQNAMLLTSMNTPVSEASTLRVSNK